MGTQDWATRGKQFELLEKAEWHGVRNGRVSFEHALGVGKGRRGRIDILIDELGQDALGIYETVIEVKATDWDVMADHRVRPNVLRHARQVMRYVYPFLERGVGVCPAIVYPRAPSSRERRMRIEAALEERWIQVVWYDER